jgi:hypothetical protein
VLVTWQSSQFSSFAVQAAGWDVCPFSEGQVDGWALATGIMTHASRYTTEWESKIGENIRISHVRHQLGNHPKPGSRYGDIVVSFKKHILSTAETIFTGTAVPTAGSTSGSSSSTGPGTAEAEYMIKIDRVVNTLNVSFSCAGDFDARYEAWKATWFSGLLANKPRYYFDHYPRHAWLVTLLSLQSSSDRAHGKEWEALVALTAKILPQVVSKLKNEDDLFAVEICRSHLCGSRQITHDCFPVDNKLQTDTTKKVSPSDIQNYYYLDAQAKKIIQLYGSSVAAFDEQVVAWNAHQNRVSLSSHSRDYTEHPSFDAIVAMGKDHVVPLIMAKYAENPHGWWHELLHEVVHGRKSGANTFYKPMLYKEGVVRGSWRRRSSLKGNAVLCGDDSTWIVCMSHD